ncbi:hypothetical protein SAMN05216378_4498 [Paenibacillus catalpae]|uniref:Uncharacterized protein n=1 Tax=Paenibacillus catalpae TaxID=1045775 RepID=A0A1I2EA49_9BACL|nr:hypothetical protein SAMN05216378_4498 [Paenibacillus catalpae]
MNGISATLDDLASTVDKRPAVLKLFESQHVLKRGPQ